MSSFLSSSFLRRYRSLWSLFRLYSSLLFVGHRKNYSSSEDKQPRQITPSPSSPVRRHPILPLFTSDLCLVEKDLGPIFCFLSWHPPHPKRYLSWVWTTGGVEENVYSPLLSSPQPNPFPCFIRESFMWITFLLDHYFSLVLYFSVSSYLPLLLLQILTNLPSVLLVSSQCYKFHSLLPFSFSCTPTSIGLVDYIVHIEQKWSSNLYLPPPVPGLPFPFG